MWANGIRQLADDNLGGLTRCRARPRSDAAAFAENAGENTHPATVFDVTPHGRSPGVFAAECAGIFEGRRVRTVWPTAEVYAAAAVLQRGCADGACTRVWAVLPSRVRHPAKARRQWIKVDEILLDQSRMRAITGGGEHLTIIPSMDGDSPGGHRKRSRRVHRGRADSSTQRPLPSGPISRSSTRPAPEPARRRADLRGRGVLSEMSPPRGRLRALVSTVGDCRDE